jgi:hypothetical protein
MKTSITLGRLRMSRQQLMIGGGLLLLLVVVACLPNDKSAIEAAVKENLRDPGSAQFGDLVLSESGQRACIQYNGKNAFGGYGCQSACKRDPLSARKRDPLSRWRKVDRTRAFALRAA